MKARTVPILFLIIAIFIISTFFLSKYFFVDKSGDIVRAKIVTPASSEQIQMESDDFGQSVDTEKYETFVPLKSTETLISTLTLDLNNDGFDDEVIVVKKTGSQDLWIIPGINNVATGSYDRIAEIETNISKYRTFSYTGIDIIGDHRTALVYQGDANDGSYVMKIFLVVEKDGKSELKTIGEFVSDGTVFIQQTERSESYELSLSNGDSYSVWVYKSEEPTEEEIKKNKNAGLNQIQQEFKWNPVTENYELANEIKLTAGRVAAKELSRIQDGTVETFASFLNGLWYKTSNEDANIRYLYFDYDNKELILFKGDTQEVYEWEDSKLRHNGIFLSTVNASISNLHRYFTITLVNVDEIRITIRDDINLIITNNSLWDGNYKKMTSQSTFDEKKENAELNLYAEEITKTAEWKSSDLQSSLSLKDGEFLYKFNSIEEKGVYSLMRIGDYNVIQFCSNSDESMLNNTYVMKFGTKVITEKVKRKTVEKVVTNYDEISFTPVKITPVDCFAADGKQFVFERSSVNN